MNRTWTMIFVTILSFSFILGCEDEEAESCVEIDLCASEQSKCTNEAMGEKDAIFLCAQAYCKCLEEITCDAMPDLSGCGSE